MISGQLPEQDVFRKVENLRHLFHVFPGHIEEIADVFFFELFQGGQPVKPDLSAVPFQIDPQEAFEAQRGWRGGGKWQLRLLSQGCIYPCRRLHTPGFLDHIHVIGDNIA